MKSFWSCSSLQQQAAEASSSVRDCYCQHFRNAMAECQFASCTEGRALPEQPQFIFSLLLLTGRCKFAHSLQLEQMSKELLIMFMFAANKLQKPQAVSGIAMAKAATMHWQSVTLHHAQRVEHPPHVPLRPIANSCQAKNSFSSNIGR